ncbi:MAG: outer membrane lipoprotein carrier protein LolA [Bacteroidales bacterium]|nr:outer membrane lipoprotein carrier protein LolA [Bacteroidales bacterium]
MKKLLTIFFTLFLSVSAYCQYGRTATGKEKDDFFSQISHVSKETKTLTCDFTMSKESTLIQDRNESKGKMYFQAPHKLRWEYTSPNKSALIVNEQNVVLKNADGSTNTNVNTRMLKGLSDIIIGTIDGSGLQDEKNFTTTLVVFPTEIGNYRLILEPKGRLANMYKEIEIAFNGNYLAAFIELTEKNGDSMKIWFSNHKTNQQIDQNLFKIQ